MGANKSTTDAVMEMNQETFEEFISLFTDHLICVASTDGYFKKLNGAWETALGYSIKELLDVPFINFVHPDDVETTQKEMDAQAEGKPTANFVNRYRCKDGTYRWLKWKTTFVRDHRILIGKADDITDARDTEQALHESGRRLRSVFETVGLATIILDKHANVVFINDFLLKMTGWERSEVLGKNWIDTFIPDELKHISQEAFVFFMTGEEKNTSYEREILAKNGDRRLVRWNVTYLRDKDGKVEGTASIGEDITELRRAREEMQKAQRLESLGVLAGGIAHDFNNILTALVGNISLARIKLEGQDDVAKYLENAEAASFRAKGLTHQLLTFGRGSEPIKKVVKINILLKEAAGFSTHGSSVECKFALPDDLWLVEGDEGQLSQVFQNLIINAVQAMPSGGTITVSAANIGSATFRTRAVKVSIRDEGVGMSSEILPKIFDPYFSTKPTGNGLGLAASYSIIKNHGGNISVASEKGTGSTFTITVPAADPDRLAELEIQSEVLKGHGRILVLDDDQIICTLAGSMLAELGYSVECVGVGEEVVPLYQKRKAEGIPFAAVIMDITIPGSIGGKEVIPLLQQVDPEVKAIVSSGYATDPVMANYRTYGFSAILAKPYMVHEMSKVLHDLLEPKDS